MRDRENAKDPTEQIPEVVPNAETLEAFSELDSGGGYRFKGNTKQLFNELLKDQ